MNDENLEHHLRNLPAPELPEVWQGKILAEARRGARASQKSQAWPPILAYLRHLFARNPFTAGALTTLWLLIFLFHATTPIDRSSQALMAKFDPNRPVYLTTLPEEVRLALLGEEDNPPRKILMP